MGDDGHDRLGASLSDVSSEDLYNELVRTICRMQKILMWIESTFLDDEVQRELARSNEMMTQVINNLPNLAAKFRAADREIQELIIHLLRIAAADIDERFEDLKQAVEK